MLEVTRKANYDVHFRKWKKRSSRNRVVVILLETKVIYVLSVISVRKKQAVHFREISFLNFFTLGVSNK